MGYTNTAPSYSHSGASRPHAASGNRSRSSGYSRYGHLGQGLSDRGYASYVTSRSSRGLATLIRNPLSYLMGMASLGTPVGWVGKAGYASSYEHLLVCAQTAYPNASMSELLGMPTLQSQIAEMKRRAEHHGKYGDTQFGASTVGYGASRGYPAWVTKMLSKSNASNLGKPPESSSGAKGIALGIILAGKILL